MTLSTHIRAADHPDRHAFYTALQRTDDWRLAYGQTDNNNDMYDRIAAVLARHPDVLTEPEAERRVRMARDETFCPHQDEIRKLRGRLSTVLDHLARTAPDAAAQLRRRWDLDADTA